MLSGLKVGILLLNMLINLVSIMDIRLMNI